MSTILKFISNFEISKFEINFKIGATAPRRSRIRRPLARSRGVAVNRDADGQPRYYKAVPKAPLTPFDQNSALREILKGARKRNNS